MVKYLIPVLAFSVFVSACKARSYHSDVASSQATVAEDMVTIHLESYSVSQPIVFASVTSEGECRGGNPKYHVPNRTDNPGWQPGRGLPFPDLKVDLSIKRICLGGQAGGGSGGGQAPFQYWDLPAGLKGGETLVIKGEKITVSGASGDQNGSSGATLTCESHGAKVVLNKVGEKFVATIAGKAAELIRDEQGKPVMAIGGGYDSGKTWETKKTLRHWALSTNFDKPSESPQVTIKDLRSTDVGYYTDQFGPFISSNAEGYKLVVTYFEMTGSHNTMMYEYANWFWAKADCK